MVSNVKSTISDIKTFVEILFNLRNELVFKLPNLLHPSVPISNSENDNIVIFQNSQHEIKQFDQYQLCIKLGIIEDATDIAGNRGYYLTNEGVRLNYALINYALDFLENKNYKLMYTPHFIDKKYMKNICQLTEFEETLYQIDKSDNYLIATSEQSLTAYFSGKKFIDTPVKICGISTCYRKEAKESAMWLRIMLRTNEGELKEQLEKLCGEAIELKKIFSAIINKSGDS